MKQIWMARLMLMPEQRIPRQRGDAVMRIEAGGMMVIPCHDSTPLDFVSLHIHSSPVG